MILAIYRIMIINRQRKGKLKASNPKKQPFVDALWEFIIPVGLILLGDGIILMQPHLSCFLIIGVVTVVCFLVSGIKLRSWVIGCSVYLILLAIVFGIVMAVPSAREKVVDKIETNFAHVSTARMKSMSRPNRRKTNPVRSTELRTLSVQAECSDRVSVIQDINILTYRRLITTTSSRSMLRRRVLWEERS